MKKPRHFVPGIDISYWNTHSLDVNGITTMLNAAKARGVQWVMFRAGKGGSESGITSWGEDRKMTDIMLALDETSLPSLAYWRLYDILNEDPIEQAHRAAQVFEVAATNATGSDVPMILDIEELWPTGTQVDPIAVIEVIKFWVSEFRSTLGRLGITNVGVYTRRTWWDPYVGLPWGETPLFTSHWVRELVPQDATVWDSWAFLKMKDGPWIPSAWKSADVWQFAAAGSGFGTVIGASSPDLDCNLMKAEFFDKYLT